MSKPTTADLAEQVAAMRIELAAHAEIAARVVELAARLEAVENDPTLARPRAARADRERLNALAAEQERNRAAAAAAKAEREKAERQERLEAAEREVEGASHVRLYVTRASFSLVERNPVLSYLSVSPYHPRDISLGEWRAALAADRGEIRDGIGSGALQIARLPDEWFSLTSGEQLRWSNKFTERVMPPQGASCR